VDDGICKPILLGNPELIQRNIEAYDLRLKIGENITVVDPRNNPDYERHVEEHYAAMCRKGVTPTYSRRVMTARTTQIAAVMVRCGDADAMICGVEGNFISHLHLRAGFDWGASRFERCGGGDDADFEARHVFPHRYARRR